MVESQTQLDDRFRRIKKRQQIEERKKEREAEKLKRAEARHFKYKPSIHKIQLLYQQHLALLKEILEEYEANIIKVNKNGFKIKTDDGKLYRLSFLLEQQKVVSKTGNRYYRIRFNISNCKTKTFSLFTDELDVACIIYDRLDEIW